MGAYLLKRLLLAPLILLTLATVSFALVRFAPGGPFTADRMPDPEVEAAMRAQYGLNLPLHVQYGRFLRDLAVGDLGPSISQKGRTVNEIIARNLPHSLLLGAMALVVALSLGIGGGLLAAVHQHDTLDYGTMALAVLGISLPTFVIGPLLQLVVGRELGWLPIAGYAGPTQVQYLILPAITLGIPFAARLSRLTRAGMLDVLSSDFVRTARAKGLSTWTILRRHCLRGGLLPVVSYLGPAATMMATGSLVVEQIFQIPGLGREFIQSSLSRDYPLVLGTVMLYGVFIVITNLLADLAYAWLDPRVRLA